jgi:hypothetical protein
MFRLPLYSEANLRGTLAAFESCLLSPSEAGDLASEIRGTFEEIYASHPGMIDGAGL